MVDGDAGAGGDGVEEYFDFRAFAGDEVDAAPFELELAGRVPGGDCSGGESFCFKAFGEGAAELGLKANDSGGAAGDAVFGAATPPEVRLFGEEAKGGGGVGIDGNGDGDFIAWGHFFLRLLT